MTRSGRSSPAPAGLVLAVLIGASGVLACQPVTGQSQAPDAASPDAGFASDGGLPFETDAGLADAGSVDAGLTDAGSADAGSTDAGQTDAGPPIEGVWTRWVPPGIPARDATAIVFDSVRGVSFLFGGCCDEQLNELSDSWTRSGTVWTQAAPSISPPARADHAMAWDSRRGVAVLFGGAVRGNDLGDTWEWNGTSWSQASPVVSPPARSSHALAYDATRGVTVLFGGYSAGQSSDLNDTWEWDGTTWTQRMPVVSPPPRDSFGMIYDTTRGVSLLFGGYDASSDQERDDTWEWNGARWTQLLPTTAPAARSGYALAFNPQQDAAILFGGDTGAVGPLGDIWEWTGTWTQLSPNGNPAPRSEAAMLYDQTRGVAVLFGGLSQDQGADANDTWEWNGTTWSVATAETSPPAISEHVMTFDSARGVTVLFGGASNTDPSLPALTWEWNGLTWTHASPPGSPPVLAEPAMAYDSRRGVSVLFGPNTWEWNGTTWLQRSPPTSPAVTYGAAMAYDSARGVTVLFGGVATRRIRTIGTTPGSGMEPRGRRPSRWTFRPRGSNPPWRTTPRVA